MCFWNLNSEGNSYEIFDYNNLGWIKRFVEILFELELIKVKLLRLEFSMLKPTESTF